MRQIPKNMSHDDRIVDHSINIWKQECAQLKGSVQNQQSLATCAVVACKMVVSSLSTQTKYIALFGTCRS